MCGYRLQCLCGLRGPGSVPRVPAVPRAEAAPALAMMSSGTVRGRSSFAGLEAGDGGAVAQPVFLSLPPRPVRGSLHARQPPLCFELPSLRPHRSSARAKAGLRCCGEANSSKSEMGYPSRDACCRTLVPGYARLEPVFRCVHHKLHGRLPSPEGTCKRS